MATILLVHGCPGDASSWDPLRATVGAHALTLPDHGADAPTATVDDHIAHVASAIDREPGPVVLVGHSYGAWVAAHAAARAAGRVERLVTLAGLAEVSGATAAGLAGFAQALEAGALSAEAAAAIASQGWLGPGAPEAQHARVAALFAREGAARLARQLRRAVTATAVVPRSSAAARVIAIEHDAVVSRAASEALASALGVHVELLPGASHFPHWNDAHDHSTVARACGL